LILFDCGEGTQIPWRRFHWGFRRVGAICLTHWHADHVGGLPGILFSMANAGRVEPVDLFGPVGIAPIVAGLRVNDPALPYQLRLVELAGGESFPLPGGLRGSCVSGLHGLPTLAFRADAARARRFDPDRAEALGVPQPLWRQLQNGESVTWAGGTASPDEVLGPPRRGLAVGFVTDTRPLPAHRPFLQEVDLLVCEGTYGDPADAEKAVEWGHMTFAEAADLARDAGARQLWLSHFSPGLTDPDAWVTEATDRFPETTIGFSGLTTTLNFADGD
jgi:ribonuclease Z